MTSVLLIGFGLVAATGLIALAARRLQIPYSILLVMAGVAIGFLPALPQVAIKPDLVLLLLLPPLLYTSGVGMSWLGFKANLRPIMLLAVGCVLFTATAVAAAAHYLLGMPWAVGFVLGAIVSPPDAVAPMAIARRFAIPQRILTVLEGEGLVNDATALIVFSFAVAAVQSGQFSLLRATLEFLAIVGGELLWGWFIGWAALRIRRWAEYPQVEIVFALLTPFAAFWPPEMLGGSGVLATVIAGLYVSWNGRNLISPATRLQGFFVWDLVVYVIEGVIFLLTGLQARVIADGLNAPGWQRVMLAGALISAVIIVVRFLWVFIGTYVPRWFSRRLRERDPAPPWQHSFVVGFTGIRGVVSLAAALSIPLIGKGDVFPERELLLAVTFGVILVTLVGQGWTFPWLIRRLGLIDAGRREAENAKRREVAARIAAIEAALKRLDEIEAEGASEAGIAAQRRRHADRRAYFQSAAEGAQLGAPPLDNTDIQLRLVEAERESVAQLYLAGELDDDARRRIERELDLEDSRIRHAAHSGNARLGPAQVGE